MTRFGHQAEIQQKYGLAAFVDVAAELAAWIADQAWMTGDGPKAIFGGVVAWLRKHQAPLPGITSLEKPVATGREIADKRLWRSRLLTEVFRLMADIWARKLWSRRPWGRCGVRHRRGLRM